MSELKKRLEEVRGKVMSSIQKVRGQIPIIGERGGMAGQINIGGGQIAGITADISDVAKEYINALRTGKLDEVTRVARFTPLRNKLERRFPALSKLPRVREVPKSERVAGLPPVPQAPKVKEEALSRQPPEVKPPERRAAIY